MKNRDKTGDFSLFKGFYFLKHDNTYAKRDTKRDTSDFFKKWEIKEVSN